MTEEQKKIALETLAADEAREARRREGSDIHYTSRSEQNINQKQEKSHNAVKGTLASVGVGAKEGVKNTIFNGKAFVQTDLGAGKATGLQTAERAVGEGVDYDTFMQEMRDKYGSLQTFWPIRMSQDERDVYASLLQKKKLGLTDVASLESAQAEQASKQAKIDSERLERSMKSQAALRAVDDKYELGKVGEAAQELGAAAGQMLPSLAAGVVNPGLGLTTMAGQAALQAYGQALDEGASHEEATRYGAASGAKEAAIERMTGGLGRFYGKGVLDKAIRMQANDSAKHVLANTAKGMIGEGAEEAVSGFLDPFIQRATYNPSAENATAGDLAYQAALGAALGGILGGGSNVLEYGATKRAKNTATEKEATLDGAKGVPNGSVPGDVSSVASTPSISASELTVKYNPAKSPYEQAMDSMLKGEDGTKAAKVESEDDRAVKRFIQSAAVNARLGVEYRDMPLNQKAYYKDGKIYINQNRSLSEGMKSTVAHEIYHALEGSKEHDKIVELALKNVGEGAIEDKIANYGKYGIQLDENGARAEIGADFIERALTDEATINEVLLENRSLAGRILERIKDMLAVYKAKKNMSVKEAEEYKSLLRARRLYEDGLRKLHEGEYEPASGERSARYGVDSFRQDKKAGIMRRDLINSGLFGEVDTAENVAKVDEFIGELDKLADHIASYSSTFLDIGPVDKDARTFSPVKKNTDKLYKISIDFSTLCRKRIMTQAALEATQVQLSKQNGKAKVLSREEQAALRDKLKELKSENDQIEVACALCYVEAARYRQPKYIEKFLNSPKSVIEDYYRGSGAKSAIKRAEIETKLRLGYDAKSSIKSIKAKSTSDASEVQRAKKEAKQSYTSFTTHEAEEIAFANTISDNPELILTASGLAKLKKEHPDIYKAFNMFITARTHAKALETGESYFWGDMNSVSDELIAEMNHQNGIRHQSWSDFEVLRLLDEIVMLTEVAVRGGKMQYYTKVPALIHVAGRTGAMGNMSVVPAGVKGIDESGKLVFDPIEGMPIETAVELRDAYPDTSGTIAIGINDEQIVKLLDAEYIDYVVPYHISGLSKGMRTMMQLDGWKDYTRFQFETRGGKSVEDGIRFDDWFNPSDADTVSKTGLEIMREAQARYLALCKERGIEPKFKQFSHNENYWKLLIDRKMINNKTGAIIIQQKLKPNFDFEKITKIVDDESKKDPAETIEKIKKIAADMYKPRGDGSTEMQERIEILSKGPSKKNEKRFSIDSNLKDYQKRSKYLANSDENLQNFMKDSVVKNEDGTPKVVYSGHGNSNLFGSKFDVKKATSGGFYFTESPEIASSYAKDKLGNMERYENGDEYRFKNAKGEYKDTIDKVRLSDEQVAKFDEWFMDDMGYTWDDYLQENAPYDEQLRGLRGNGGKYNLQNVYKLMESLGYADNGWDYRTNSQGKSTFEDLLDEMGIDWDSYNRQAGGVFPVYLDIRNPIDTSKPFPQDLLNELEYQASKERKSEGEHWTKDYPLRDWVSDIKSDDGNSGWATQVPTKARKIMLEMGYDGIKDTGGKLGGAEHTVWVALEPTQVKSAIGNRGTFDATKADMRYSIDDVPSVRDDVSDGEKVGYRFFDNTFQNTPIFDDAVKEIERSYEHERARVSEKENIAEARRRLEENGWHEEIKTVLNKNSVDGADTDVAMAIISQLNNYSSDSAEFGRIMKFAEDYADKTVESGQFIQSLAKYSRTPVGKTEKAMRDIKREERRIQESNPKQWNNVEKKASKARRAYKEAREEAAGETIGEAIERVTDSVDIESAEKIVNAAAKERKNRQKNNSKDKQDNSAERLAAKIQSHITPKSDTVDNAKFQRDVINELYKLAKESPLPDKAINVQKKDYVKIMREILHNQEKYADVWQDAREILGKRYKDDAEKMSALEGYFDNFIVPVYSEDSMRVVLRDVMKELGLDVRGVLTSSKSDKASTREKVREVLTSSKSDKASTREKVREVLAEKLGLDEFDEQTVDVVTNDIFNTYDKMLKEKAEKKLEKFLDDEVKDKKKSEPLKKQMMRMVRNGTFDEDEVTRIIKKAYDVPSLTTEETREILSYYEQADAFAEGSYDRRKWEAKAQKIIADKAPKTFSEKNKTLRRIAMLTNPATWERNIVGNVVFSGAEALKNLPAGLVDMGVAKITGKRTTSANIVADAGAFAKGFARGGKEWWEDIKYGVDTSHGAVREEYQGSGSTFSDKHLYGRLANKAETVMSKALQIGDRPFYEAAYDQRINELKRLGYDTNSEAIKAETEIYALERVYQNDSKISKALTNVRNELGLFGHFLVPFTQTPGNLLDKCIDYSGVGGLARAVYQLGAAKKTGVFDQKVFVDRIGRALTGVGMLTFGAFLGSKGFLIGTEDDDYKVSGAKRLAGEKEYSLRIGDHYYTIDWAQPVSAILIAGAEAHKAGLEQDDLMQIGVASGKGVINTLFAMSCLEGLESMMSSYGDAEPADKIADVFVSGVSQYFPTALRRLNNIIDPVQRQTYSANPLIKEGKYLLSGVPVASYLLEPKYTLEGDVQYKSQGRNAASRVVENFLSPANVGVKYASEVNDELLRIYEKTGAKSQFLHYAQKKLDYGDGGKYVLAAEDYNRMQKEIGTNTVKADKELMRSSVYKNMSDDDKAEALGEIATFYDNKFKEDYAKKNEIDFNNLSYESLKKKVADAGGWANYFEVKNAFPDSSYESAKKRKEKCDKYGIDYTAYAESSEKISDLRSANTAKFKELEAEGKKVKSSDKTESNKRAIAKYLAGRKDLTNPQKQVIWQEYYSGKSSESYISVARRCGFI